MRSGLSRQEIAPSSWVGSPEGSVIVCIAYVRPFITQLFPILDVVGGWPGDSRSTISMIKTVMISSQFL